MDSLSQCVANETATQVKERSVSNGFPTALLYMASFKLKDVYSDYTVRFNAQNRVHTFQYTHNIFNKVGMK